MSRPEEARLMPPTYTVSTYDVVDDPYKDGDWTVRAEGVSLWGLRPIVRSLMGEGYEWLSIGVVRERPAACRKELR